MLIYDEEERKKTKGEGRLRKRERTQTILRREVWKTKKKKKKKKKGKLCVATRTRCAKGAFFFVSFQFLLANLFGFRQQTWWVAMSLLLGFKPICFLKSARTPVLSSSLLSGFIPGNSKNQGRIITALSSSFSSSFQNHRPRPPTTTPPSPPPTTAKRMIRVVQFNTLGKHLAEGISYPYAVDLPSDNNNVNNTTDNNRFSSWTAYAPPRWALPTLLELSDTPLQYFKGELKKEEEEEEKGKEEEGKGKGKEKSKEEKTGRFQLQEGTSNGLVILSWEERVERLAEDVLEKNPDLIFLQEVEEDCVQDFERLLKGRVVRKGGEGEEKGKRGEEEGGEDVVFEGVFASRGNGKKDGIAILWKKERLVGVGEGVLVRFSVGNKICLMQELRMVEGGRKGIGGDNANNNNNDNNNNNNNNNNTTTTTTTTTTKNNHFIAATAHLHWNPSSPHQQQQAKELVSALSTPLEQLQQQQQHHHCHPHHHLHHHYHQHHHLPIILGGDFNSSPSSPPPPPPPPSWFSES